jgi:putative addiction module antidote
MNAGKYSAMESGAGLEIEVPMQSGEIPKREIPNSFKTPALQNSAVLPNPARSLRWIVI